jgi:Family of unknown function (DUF5677)
VPLRGPNSSKVNTTGIALVARSASNMRAILLLAEAGQIVEARALLRALLENFFYLGNLITEREHFVKQMYDDDASHRDGAANLFLSAR